MEFDSVERRLRALWTAGRHVRRHQVAAGLSAEMPYREQRALCPGNFNQLMLRHQLKADFVHLLSHAVDFINIFITFL